MTTPRVTIAVLCIAVALAAVADYELGKIVQLWPSEFSARAFRELILSFGYWGVAASIGLMVLHNFVPFPAEFVAIANGMCFGALWGTVITWTGAMLGSFLAFALARAFGRPFVQRATRRGDLQKLDEWLARQGGGAVFVGRFIPVIAFNLINYAAGLTRISWWTFAWTTGLGILPLTTLMVVLGDRIDKLPWAVWPLLIGAGLIVWLLGRRVLARSSRQHREGVSRSPPSAP